jgi:hypothetical protein
VNTPELSVPVSKALPAEAVAPTELSDPQAAEGPAEALAVINPEQHLDASSPNYTAVPPVATVPPSVVVTALPDDAEIVPKPVRKPVIQEPVGEPVNVTALPDDTEIVPKPSRKPVIQNPVGEPALQKPSSAPPTVDVTALPDDAEIPPKSVRNPGIQKRVGKPLIQKPMAKQRADVDFKPGSRSRTNGQNLGNKTPMPSPTGRSSTADLLAGGL